MSDLIPLLWEMNGESGVPVEFVPAFVKIHNGQSSNGRAALSGAQIQARSQKSDDDAPWRTAQSHWEVVVARVLDTDVVKPNDSGDVAIRRAVRASALLLNKLARQGRCPICPRPAMVRSH
jgi:hypothetical protein